MRDPWEHRSVAIRCSTCMWFVLKSPTQENAAIPKSDIAGPVTQSTNNKVLGRCRKHAPTLNGYPAVFTTDWCGDHKLDENKA